MRSVNPGVSPLWTLGRSRPPRRSVLTAAAALGLVLIGTLAGCTEPPPAAPPPVPDELAVDRAVASARQLRAGALLLAQTRQDLAALLRQIAAVHEAHVELLGAPAESTASPTSSVSPDPSASPAAPAQTPPQLQQAEWTAARTAMRDGEEATAVFAVLLSRIAAARAANADLVSAALGRKPSDVLTPAAPTPTASGIPTSATSAPATSAPASSAPADALPTEAGTPTAPSSPALIAVTRLLAGQHAAVFVYPLIIARTSGQPRALASTLWQAHREERDQLEATLLDAGAQPVAAEPAYDVGTVPTTATKATALAARVESGLAALAADVIAVADGSDRELGINQLVLAARRAAGWSGKPTAMPGLSSTPAASPSATPDPAATGL